MKQFETLLNGFPGIISFSSFRQLENWANKTAEQWNRLSPYDDTLRSALPRYLQMLDHQLRSRKMANLDRIDWSEFKAYLNKNEQWLAKNDIPQSVPLLQPLLTPMTTTSASALQSGELKSLPLSTATRQTSMVQALHAHSAAAITRCATALPWCKKPHRSAQITSACSSRRNLKATFS